MKTDLGHRTGGLEHHMDLHDQRMGDFAKRMERLERRMERFDDRLQDFHGALKQQTRTLVTFSMGMMLTLSIVAFGTANLI